VPQAAAWTTGTDGTRAAKGDGTRAAKGGGTCTTRRVYHGCVGVQASRRRCRTGAPTRTTHRCLPAREAARARQPPLSTATCARAPPCRLRVSARRRRPCRGARPAHDSLRP